MREDPLVLRYRALLDFIDAISRHRDLKSLMLDLASHLHTVVRFEWIAVLLCDEEHDVATSYVLEGGLPVSLFSGYQMPARETVMPQVLENQTPLIVSDLVHMKMQYPRMTEILAGDGVRSFCVLPLTTPHGRLGGIAFGSPKLRAYDQEDHEFLCQVSNQIALGVESAFAFQQIAELKDLSETAPTTSMSLHDAEREHILRMLRETRGIIGGPKGAAFLLGMKRTTLISRMKKLGISSKQTQ